MTNATVTESSGVPPPIAALLDQFDRTFPGTATALWVRSDADWRRVHPKRPAPGATPAADALRRCVLAPEGEASFELEVRGTADAAAVDLLAAALSQILRYEHETRLAARELGERYEEINLLYSISEVLGTVASLDAAAHRILEEVVDVLGARRASLWVLNPADQQLHLTAAVGKEGLTGPIPIDDPVSVTARVFRDRLPLNLERGTRIPRGTRLEPLPHGGEAFLSVPINFTPRDGESRTVGVITLVGRTTDVRFNAGDARLLTAIASQVGAALETHRLMAESVRRERRDRELELAHDLQLKLLPDTSQFRESASVAARCVPADSVGGDFYHLFRLSGDRIGVMIGDVSSHGFSAALIMAMTMSAVAIYAPESGPPAAVLRRVHEALIDELESTEMHLSLFYGVLDAGAGRLVYANAGHPHAFRIDGAGVVQRLGAIGPPLGIAPTYDCGEAVTEWRADEDLLCLFTDGLSDAFAEGGSCGEAQLMAEVTRLRDRPPAEILDRLFTAAGRSRPAVPPDDRTAVLIRA